MSTAPQWAPQVDVDWIERKPDYRLQTFRLTINNRIMLSLPLNFSQPFTGCVAERAVSLISAWVMCSPACCSCADRPLDGSACDALFVVCSRL